MKKSKEQKDMPLHEASEFWDEHDLGEFEDVTEATDLRFALKKRKYVGIDVKLYFRIRDKAKKLHKTEDVLINEWLAEKVKA